ncbi:MAG TPA: hypothetical protein PK156_51500, partial [Polyangium sp.]|nr:hypothetical protein [Polyangium sp.]
NTSGCPTGTGNSPRPCAGASQGGCPSGNSSIDSLTHAGPDGWDGAWDGVVDVYDNLDTMVPDSHASQVAAVQTMFAMADAYQNGGVVDAINVVNPMMSVVTLGYAIKEGDSYTAGRTGVHVGVTILGAVIGGKLMAGTGPKGGTYRLVDRKTREVMRNGRTNNHLRREPEHQRHPVLRQYPYEVVTRTDDPVVQRGLEQLQMERTPGKYDKIKGISDRNPMRQVYIDAALTWLKDNGVEL